ncbi:MAG: hypothetical protein ACK5VE_06530 [Alphaproteobacteria bacterium]
MSNWEIAKAKLGLKGDKGMCRCPVHDDRVGSLSVKRNGDDAVVHCFAGCSWQAIRAALGLTASNPPTPTVRADVRPPAHRVVASYGYAEEFGDVIAMKLRYEPKRFAWQVLHPDGQMRYGFDEARGLTLANLPPYQLPLAIEAVRSGVMLHVVEGEKSADALIALGLPATCVPEGGGGSASAYAPGRWRSWLPPGALIALWPDHDDVGAKHMERLGAMLAELGATVHMVSNGDMPPKGDVYDLIQQYRDDGLTPTGIADRLRYRAIHAPPLVAFPSGSNSPGASNTRGALPDDVQEAITERAAIYEYGAGWPRETAERVATAQHVARHAASLAALPLAARLAATCSDPTRKALYLELAQLDAG